MEGGGAEWLGNVMLSACPQRQKDRKRQERRGLELKAKSEAVSESPGCAGRPAQWAGGTSALIRA